MINLDCFCICPKDTRRRNVRVSFCPHGVGRPRARFRVRFTRFTVCRERSFESWMRYSVKVDQHMTHGLLMVVRAWEEHRPVQSRDRPKGKMETSHQRCTLHTTATDAESHRVYDRRLDDSSARQHRRGQDRKGRFRHG
jgi:hypothetical protein